MNDSSQKYQHYQILDTLFRLHEDLYQIEHVSKQNLVAQYRHMSIIVEGAGGLSLAAAIGVLAFVVSALGQRWNSAPVLVVYGVLALVILIWIRESFGVRKVRKDLGIDNAVNATLPLSQQRDYLLDQVAMYAIRARAIEDVMRDVDGVASAISPPSRFGPRQDRVILDHSLARLAATIALSEELLARTLRSQADHDELLRWAAPFLDAVNELKKSVAE